MKLLSQIKPISYLKAHAAEIVRNLSSQGEPLVITQNGETKVVMQDIESYEQTQETMGRGKNTLPQIPHRLNRNEPGFQASHSFQSLLYFTHGFPG